MTYKINSTELTIQPTTGRWVPRQQVGVSGAGYPIYSGVRQFEMKFVLDTPSAVNQLQGFFDSIGITGSAVVDLPEYTKSTYSFREYSGCIVREPEFGEYYNEHQTSVTLLITSIRT